MNLELREVMIEVCKLLSELLGRRLRLIVVPTRGDLDAEARMRPPRRSGVTTTAVGPHFA